MIHSSLSECIPFRTPSIERTPNLNAIPKNYENHYWKWDMDKKYAKSRDAANMKQKIDIENFFLWIKEKESRKLSGGRQAFYIITYIYLIP